MRKKIILLIIIIIVTFGGLFGSKFLQINQAMSSRKPPPPPTVTAISVVEKQWANSLATVGTVNPSLGVVISNEIAGTVSKLHVESGASVTEGDLILELDTSSDRAKLKGLVAKKQLAQIKFDRLSKLLKRDVISKSSYDEARAELDIAHADVIEQQSLISKKRIKAPFTGELGIRQVSLGEYIDKGTQIIPLVSLSTTITDFSLPERYYAQLSVGQAITVRVQAYPGETFEGVIQAINPGLHEETRTVAIRATLKNPDKKLRTGMFADINIITSSPNTVLTLPETAILFSTYGDSTYLIKQQDGQHTVELKNIKTGERREGYIEIISGLNKNDLVVDEGHVKLRHGQAVTLAN